MVLNQQLIQEKTTVYTKEIIKIIKLALLGLEVTQQNLCETSHLQLSYESCFK